MKNKTKYHLQIKKQKDQIDVRDDNGIKERNIFFWGEGEGNRM